MNVSAFNENVSPDELRKLGIDPRVLRAPLIYIEEFKRFELEEFCQKHISDNPAEEGILAPFSLSRIYLRTKDYFPSRFVTRPPSMGINGEMFFRLWVDALSDVVRIYCVAGGTKGTTFQGDRLWSFTELNGFRETADIDAAISAAKERQCKTRCWTIGKKEIFDAGVLREIRVQLWIFAIACFIKCAYPGNFLAAVRPDKQNKSVEWMEARTHYVILHRSHPANSQTVNHGSHVQDTDRHIRRQAHSRRAHFRLLRSARFKKKVGQRIPVRSTWVGPKEWRQGSSIYRIK